MKLQHTFLTFVFLLVATFTFAQSYTGTWKTIDDETGKAKSHVEIYEQDGKLYGKVVEILNPDRKDAVCEKCKGNKKNQSVQGMVIVEGLTPKNDYYDRGTITDPENGKEYGCSIWLEDGTLKVRGKHWTGIYRTQTWYRLK